MHKIATTIKRFLCFCAMSELIDFGHDEIEGQECKDGRSRTWMLLLYPDNPEHLKVVQETLPELDWNYAGILQDKDANAKPHYHIVCAFPNGITKSSVASYLGIEPRWLRAWDKQKKALRYLCHLDDPHKYQYNADEIFGTLAEKAIAQCRKKEIDESQCVEEIMNTLDEIEGFVSLSFFYRLINKKGLFSVFRRMGVLGMRLIDEHNDFYSRQLSKETEDIFY